ncbi:MAG: metal ABC transporter ATP-binding protein [Lachnospiraceae bacterium]|nr:metal ABC transporter ATP-binding protein [Lachnospiraceae bacterium]
MAQLTCNDVSLGYEGTTVTEKINFTVNQGDYLCIVGENGSGKSTLIKALLGLKMPIKGEIKYGDDLESSQIGYLPQQTIVQKDFPASVMEIVLSGFVGNRKFRPFYSKEEKAEALRIMKRLDILDFKNRCYRDLSGGQQQRVLLARALCATKTLLLLDEPVAGLDPKVTNEMYELISKINKEDNITIIMVSHDIAAAVNYATHILHLSDKPLFFGTKDDYVNSSIGKVFTDLSINGGAN